MTKTQDHVEEWNRNFNQEPFAKLFATPHGQLLAYIDYEAEDEQYVIRTVGAAVRGVVPKANLGYDSEEARQDAFGKIDEAMADRTARTLFETADRFAPPGDS
jgi:hypothetical protein